MNNILEFGEYAPVLLNLTCEKNCLLCTESNYCELCKVPYLTFAGKCINECPIDMIMDKGSCKYCNFPSNCFKCSFDDTSICT